MSNLLRSITSDIQLTLHKATVIHANKYSVAHDGGINLPLWSTLHTEVVFRLDQSQEDWRLYVKNLDLPLYTSQPVTIVSSDKNVLAYIDAQTNEYYYTARNFSSSLKLGMPFFWVWLVGIIGGILIYFIQRPQSTFLMFVPLIAIWFLYTIQKQVIHYQIKKEIDKFLS